MIHSRHLNPRLGCTLRFGHFGGDFCSATRSRFVSHNPEFRKYQFRTVWRSNTMLHGPNRIQSTFLSVWNQIRLVAITFNPIWMQFQWFFVFFSSFFRLLFVSSLSKQKTRFYKPSGLSWMDATRSGLHPEHICDSWESNSINCSVFAPDSVPNRIDFRLLFVFFSSFQIHIL